MGDIFQMLRRLSEVSSDPAGNGAFPQALVLGGLGQRLWLQRLVNTKDDKEQNCPPVPPTTHFLWISTQMTAAGLIGREFVSSLYVFTDYW